MEDEVFEHPKTFCWICFAGKMPASNILNRILWVQEDERRAMIVNPAEKNHGCRRDGIRDFKMKNQHQSH
jgi:hypothetical protein